VDRADEIDLLGQRVANVEDSTRSACVSVTATTDTLKKSRSSPVPPGAGSIPRKYRA
jgi:hypothetical protein